jgi:alpha-mannosidase
VKVFLLENQVLSEVVEVETFVNSINVTDGQGKEVVIALTSQVDNQNTFITDSNGLNFQERKINFRPSWDLQVIHI